MVTLYIRTFVVYNMKLTNSYFSFEFDIAVVATCERHHRRVPLPRRGGLHRDRQDGLVQGQARTDVGA